VIAVRLAADGLGRAGLDATASAGRVIGVVIMVIVVIVVIRGSSGGDDGGSGGWGDGHDCRGGGGGGDGTIAMPVCIKSTSGR
jgi:hypothetical protein